MAALIDGKYEVIAKLKEGGMGSIYKVRHVLLDEVRVVKTMRSQVEDDPDTKKRFFREAKMATSLKHPNIAKLLDFVEDQNHTFYMVMEYISGANLAETIKVRGTLPLGTSLDIAIQTLDALAYLHKRGIVHRDISPENIMLTRDADGKVLAKLIDLGVARQSQNEGMTMTGMFVGKLKYGSPEQLGVLKKGETIDGRSDIYSLGCVLFLLFTGAPAIEAATPGAYIMKHTHEPPRSFDEVDPSGSVPNEVRVAITKALAKSRDDRWSDADEFADALRIARDRLFGEGALEDNSDRTVPIERWEHMRSPSESVRAPLPEPVAPPRTEAPRSEPPRAEPPRAVPKPIASKPVMPKPVEVPVQPSRPVSPPRAVERPPKADHEPAAVQPPVQKKTKKSTPSAAPAPRRSAVQQPAVPPKERNWPLLVLLCLVGLIALVLVLAVVRARRSTMMTPALIAGPPGAVLLTTMPWARVEEIVNLETKKRRDGSVGITPVRIPLDPGRYRIKVRGEARGAQTGVMEVEVVSGRDTAANIPLNPTFDLEAAVRLYVQ